MRRPEPDRQRHGCYSGRYRNFGKRRRVDARRDRVQYPDLKRKGHALRDRYRPRVILIEKAGPGYTLLQDLWAEDSLYPRPIGRTPKGSKVDRMVADSAKIEAGQVWLPKDAPWLDTYLNELVAFPHGRHDDQVDSTSQFLNWIARNDAHHEVIAGGIIVPRTM